MRQWCLPHPEIIRQYNLVSVQVAGVKSCMSYIMLSLQHQGHRGQQKVHTCIFVNVMT